MRGNLTHLPPRPPLTQPPLARGPSPGPVSGEPPQRRARPCGPLQPHDLSLLPWTHVTGVPREQGKGPRGKSPRRRSTGGGVCVASGAADRRGTEAVGPWAGLPTSGGHHPPPLENKSSHTPRSVLGSSTVGQRPGDSPTGHCHEGPRSLPHPYFAKISRYRRETWGARRSQNEKGAPRQQTAALPGGPAHGPSQSPGFSRRHPAAGSWGRPPCTSHLKLPVHPGLCRGGHG